MTRRIPKKFQGDKLKNLRKQYKMSLQAVADKLGTSRSYIWELENYKTQPGGFKLMELCNLFGVQCQYFYNENEIKVHDLAILGRYVTNFVEVMQKND